MYNGNNFKNSWTALSSWFTHQSHQKSRRQVGEWQGCRQHTGWNHCDYRKKQNNEKSEMERYTLPQDSYLILKSNSKSVDRLYETSDNFNRAVITNSLIQLEYRIKIWEYRKGKKKKSVRVEFKAAEKEVGLELHDSMDEDHLMRFGCFLFFFSR